MAFTAAVKKESNDRKGRGREGEHNGLETKAQIRDSFLMLLASTDTAVVVIVIISDERGCRTNEVLDMSQWS